jgi:hypothetical protein
MEHNAEQQARAERLAQLLITAPDEPACATCLDALEAYVDAQLAGKAYQEHMPQVAQHLDSCVACAESYALLYQARLLEGKLPTPARIPAPNLSFLPAAADVRLSAALGQAVERIGARLRLVFSQSLLDLLPPPAAPAMALRGEAADALIDLAITQPDATISELRLTIYRTEEASDQYDLRIQVALLGREWPDLGGIAVSLTVGHELRRAPTDAWGEVVFTALPAAALPSIQIQVDADAAASA